MYKRFVVAGLSLCLIISLTGAALSQDTPKQAPMKPPAPEKAPQGKQFLGEVVKVDAKTKQVVVRSQEGDKTFNAAKATLSGYQTIADVKPGDKVAILYEEKGGKLTAQLIVNHAAMMKAPHPPTK